MLSIEIQINGTPMYYVNVKNVDPNFDGTDGECPYEVVTHDGEQGFVVHRRSDGALQLAEMVLDKLGLMERIGQYTPKYMNDRKGEGDGKEEI